jgi:hypothetical protein
MAFVTDSRRPLGLAFALTPLVTPLAFFLICAVYFLATGEVHRGSSWLASLGFFYLFGVPVGYLALGILGWPLIIVLRRWNRLSARYVCLGASIIGALSFAAFVTAIGTHPTPGAVFTSGLTILSGLIAGLLAGVIFCVIAGLPWQARD